MSDAFLQLFESEFFNVSKEEAPLQARYQKWNQQLFKGALPTIPISWAKIKRATGQTLYSVRPVGPGPSPLEIRMGVATKYEHCVLVPGSLRMKLSNLWQRTEEELDKIMIHEMIHVYMVAINELFGENHGPNFVVMARELSEKVGFQIPLSDSTMNAPLANPEHVKALAVIVKPRWDTCEVAITTISIMARTLEKFKERSAMRRDTLIVYTISSPVWTKRSFDYPVARDPLRTGYYVILKDHPAMQELERDGYVLLRMDHGKVIDEKSAIAA